jgi:calcineurin-like phosphoesterase family protein
MTVFFTADTHFGHAGARALYRRPFPSVAAMDEAMLARWNEVVGPGDEVWHLGDFAVGRKAIDAAAALLARLNGRKHLVIGNNDPPAVSALPEWASAGHYAELEVDGVGVVLCHYPFRTWRNAARGWVNLHGHSHGRLRPPLTRQADVGVDAHDFRPVTLAQAFGARRRAPPGPIKRAGAAGGSASS